MRFLWLKGIQDDVFEGVSFSDVSFFTPCAPLFVLTLLALSKRWSRFVDRPAVFALVYSIPFFLFSFAKSLGDSGQTVDLIHMRYWMSEPLSTWYHHWFYRIFAHALNFSPIMAIAMSHRLLGVLFLWAVARTSIVLFPDAPAQKRLCYRLVFATAGITLFFFGYIENTPPAMALEQVWVWLTMLFLTATSSLRLVMMSLLFSLSLLSHGRVVFMFPAFLAAIVMPAGSFTRRIGRLFLAGAVSATFFFGFVAYIYFFDRAYIVGWPLGNGLGGGNSTMFNPIAWVVAPQHYIDFSKFMLIAGGAFTPAALFMAVYGVIKRNSILTWCALFLLCGILYTSIWEFDYGPFADWDLVFSGFAPFALLGGIAAASQRVPVPVTVLACLFSTYMTMTFATIINQKPLQFTVPPKALPAAESVACSLPGLKTTYFSSETKESILGVVDSDTLTREYYPSTEPTLGRPVLSDSSGYIRILREGRYRVVVSASGKCRLSLGGVALIDSWRAFREFKQEAEVYIPREGLYPIEVAFSSPARSARVKVHLERADTGPKEVELGALCH